MASIRQDKVARLIQRDLSEIFQREGSRFLPGAMITVTVVRVAPDFSFAKVFLSIFPSTDKKADLEKVREHTSEIRKELGNRIRHQMRIVPELAFHIDDSLDYAERINELLK